MSKNILLAEIKTELEKIENLLSSGEPDDVRRSRISNHGDELKALKKQLETGSAGEKEIREKLKNLKDSLKTI